MSLELALEQLATARRQVATIEPPHGDAFASLFRIFVALDTEMPRSGEGDAADAFLDAQSEIISLAAQTPADDLRGVLYKLALWRWDSPNLNAPCDQMERCDAVGYAAFRDLARLLRVHEVMKDTDRGMQVDALRNGAQTA